ncbi:MAG: HAMP domain-containing sensor histidine kinase, partial [Acidimicrobiia bacterium]|nr:HAMP domain-containing sensor histidine kinase [Acidimicrobiia bacterium]
MARRFFWSMVAVAVLTLTIGGVTAAILINRSVERSVRDEFARQASATARIIESQFVVNPQGERPTVRDAPVAGRRPGDVLALVGAIGGHDHVEAALVGPRGDVTVVGRDDVLLEQVPDLPGLDSAYAFDAEVDGGQVAAVAQPFGFGQRARLVVVIGTDLDLVPWPDVLARFAWAIALGILLAAVLAGMLARRLASRVEPLEDASARIADGDFGARVPVQGEDELTQVAIAFNEMARQLEAARGREREFLVSVSHDLRTPLTTIAGYAEAMEEGRVSDDDLERVAAVLGTEANRLSRLVEDLMLLSRIEAREFGLRPEPVDVAAHLEGLLDGFRVGADGANVSVDVYFDPVGMVEFDPDRV